jgi:hypothetical protein
MNRHSAPSVGNGTVSEPKAGIVSVARMQASDRRQAKKVKFTEVGQITESGA